MSEQVSESLPSRILDRAHAWSPFVLALAVFLLLRPYDGIVHDARLYVGYALADWDPMGIGRDLMFLHDGQSGKTIFPQLLKRAISVAGVGPAALGFTLLSLVLWFFAAWRFVGAISPMHYRNSERAATVIWATTLSTWYGATGVFRYAEAFATPRPIAEALVLLALALVIERLQSRESGTSVRPGVVIEASLLTLAVALHPLMALPGAAIWLWLRFERFRLVSLILGCVLVAAMMLASHWGVSQRHDSHLLAHFDPQWYAVLRDRGALVLTSQWTTSDFARVTVHVTTIFTALHILPARIRVAFFATGMAALASVGLTWLASDVYKSVLLTQLQPWRVLWLTTLFGSIALLAILRNCFRMPRMLRNPPEGVARSRVYQIGGALLLLLAWQTLEYSASSALLGIGGGLLIFGAQFVSANRLTGQVVVWALVVAMVVLWLVFDGLQAMVTIQVIDSHPDPELRWTWRNIAATGIPRVLVLLVLVPLLLRSPHPPFGRLRLGLPLVSVVLLACSLSVFDQRTPWAALIDKALEDRRNTPSRELRREVLWLDSDVATWALLGSPTWGGAFQGISKVFDRDLAIRWDQRASLVDSIAGRQWTTRADTVTLQVDTIRLRIACNWPDGPQSIVVPEENVDRGIEAKAFSTKVPKYAPPIARGQPWRRTQNYATIDCSASTRGMTSPPL